jgi:CBS domain-containing protein
MRENKLRTLPVIDGGRLEGVITQRDIMRVTSTRSNIPVIGLVMPAEILITPSMDISTAAKQMIELGLDEVPIVQSPANRTVVGIVKIEDLLRKIVNERSSQPSVGDIMTKNVVSCCESDGITVARETMEKSRLSGLPVVCHEKGLRKVVGVITQSDIIRSGAVRTSEESKKGRKVSKVSSIMRTPAIIISPEALVDEAIEIMLRKNVKRLPVLSGENLVGIISRADVIKAICE